MRFDIKNIVAKNWLPIILIILAAFLRLYRLPEYMTFLGDQGRDAIVIKRILAFQHFPAIGAPSSVGQVYLGPFYYYLITPFLFLFNYNPVGLAYAVVLISIIGAVFSYIIVKRYTNKSTAIIFLILLVFSAVNIALSRYSWNPNLLPVFSFMTLYFCYLFLKTKSPASAILLGSFFSFSLQLHYLGAFLFFPMAAMMTVHLAKSREKKAFFTGLLNSGLTFGIFSLPLIIFDIRHNFLNTNNFVKLFTSNQLTGNDSSLDRFFSTGQNLINHIFGLNLNIWVAMIFLLIVAYLYWKNYKRANDFLHLHFLNMIFFLIGFSFLNSPRYPHYYGPVYYSFFLVSSFVLSRYTKNFFLKYFIIPFAIILYIVLNYRGYYFFHIPPSNQITVAKTIAKSIIVQKPQLPYQFIALPVNETTGHVRYFLELSPYIPLEEDSASEPKELFVLCNSPSCQVLGNPQWQIAAFKDKKIDKIWSIEGIKIYKLIHDK